MNKYIYCLFCWFIFCPHGASQEITHRDFNLYIQSISGLMPAKFIDRQWLLINKDSITKAETDFITIQNLEYLGDHELANTYFAFASFHLFILKNQDISCQLSQLGLEIIPHTKLIPPIYYSHLKINCSQNNSILNQHNRTLGPSSPNRIFAGLLCERAGIYCDKFTYVNHQIQENASIQQHPNLQILRQNLSEIQLSIQREIQRYNSLHEDFDNLFFRSTMDEQIDRNLFYFKILRINQKKGAVFHLNVIIPQNYDEEKREIVIRKVFECFASTLNIFSSRFDVNKLAEYTHVIIQGNNLDIGIAAENANTFAQQGISNIDFINTSIMRGSSQSNLIYNIELEASEFFSYYFEDMNKRIQQLELSREKIEAVLKQ